MYYFITELQTRPDGVVNSTITTRSNRAEGLSLYYQRAAAAVTSTQFLSVALTLQDQYGVIVLNECFGTLYEEPSEEESEGE